MCIQPLHLYIRNRNRETRKRASEANLSGSKRQSQVFALLRPQPAEPHTQVLHMGHSISLEDDKMDGFKTHLLLLYMTSEYITRSYFSSKTYPSPSCAVRQNRQLGKQATGRYEPAGTSPATTNAIPAKKTQGRRAEVFSYCLTAVKTAHQGKGSYTNSSVYRKNRGIKSGGETYHRDRQEWECRMPAFLRIQWVYTLPCWRG